MYQGALTVLKASAVGLEVGVQKDLGSAGHIEGVLDGASVILNDIILAALSQFCIL